MENQNIPKMGKEMESVIESFPTKNSPEQMASLVNSAKYSRKNSTNLPKSLPKIDEQGIFYNSFSEGSITLIQNPKTLEKKKLQTNFPDKHT